MTWIFDCKILFWQETPEWLKRIRKIIIAILMLLSLDSLTSVCWYLTWAIAVIVTHSSFPEINSLFRLIIIFVDWIILNFIVFYVSGIIFDKNQELLDYFISHPIPEWKTRNKWNNMRACQNQLTSPFYFGRINVLNKTNFRLIIFEWRK